MTDEPADEDLLLDSFSAVCAPHGPVRGERDAAGALVIDVPMAAWEPAAQHVRWALDMDFLDWLSAVDEPDADPAGIDVVLHVARTASAGASGAQARRSVGDHGPPYVERMLLRTRVGEGASLASLTGIWPGVAWHERETAEMFGLDFVGFDDGSGLGLRPLLLPEGFEGTPLRKSFVLASRAAKVWPGAKDPADAQRAGRSPGRRRTLPPGVPDPQQWGPREPDRPVEEPT